MEMTIARDRWQLHLKTRGDWYHQQAREMEALAGKRPETGAGTAALALHALAEILERSRTGRLTRNQHVLLRLGELIALAEGSACFARRAARALDRQISEKSDRRFDPAGLATLSRVFAREAALEVATEGLRWVAGAAEGSEGDAASLAAALNLNAVYRAQAGLLADMDRAADALYGRTATIAVAA
jgi:hypothetical protein